MKGTIPVHGITKMHNEQELQEGNSGSIEREILTSLMVNTSLYSFVLNLYIRNRLHIYRKRKAEQQKD